MVVFTAVRVQQLYGVEFSHIIGGPLYIFSPTRWNDETKQLVWEHQSNPRLLVWSTKCTYTMDGRLPLRMLETPMTRAKNQRKIAHDAQSIR